MAIGERIKYIRNLKNFTQKYLGQLIGFPEKTADIRIRSPGRSGPRRRSGRCAWRASGAARW